MKILVLAKSNDFYGELLKQLLPASQVEFRTNDSDGDSFDFVVLDPELKQEGQNFVHLPQKPISLSEFQNFLSYHILKIQKNLYFGSSILNVSENLLYDESQEEYLLEKETQIMVYLHKNENQTVTKEQMLKEIWGYSCKIDTQTVATHVYRLKNKLKKFPEIQIESDLKTGYMLKIVKLR